MNLIIFLVQIGGGLHLLLAASSFLLPIKFNYRENLSKLPPIIRQIFFVHSLQIFLILILFGALSLFFAPELAGKGHLGRFISGYIGFFWFVRVPVQFFYYDSKVKEENKAATLALTLAIIFLVGVYGMAALGGLP